MGISFFIGAGTSNEGRRFLAGICLNLRCLPALDVLRESCLPVGASHNGLLVRTLLRAANSLPREQQQLAAKAKVLPREDPLGFEYPLFPRSVPAPHIGSLLSFGAKDRVRTPTSLVRRSKS